MILIPLIMKSSMIIETHILYLPESIFTFLCDAMVHMPMMLSSSEDQQGCRQSDSGVMVSRLIGTEESLCFYRPHVSSTSAYVLRILLGLLI